MYQSNFVYTHLSGVQSSAISTVAYNENTKRMFIRFTGGSEIAYDAVPQTEYDAFVKAVSVGQYYSYNIKGSYTGEPMYNTRLRVSEAKATVPVAPSLPKPVAPTPSSKKVRFSVAWQNKDGKTGGNPEFYATDENDALVQFQTALTAAATAGFAPAKDTVKVRSITRYFD